MNETAALVLPFYCCGEERLVGSPELWALAYFKTQADALAWANAYGGTAVETTKGTIWRVQQRVI